MTHPIYLEHDPLQQETYAELEGEPCPHGMSSAPYCGRCVLAKRTDVATRHELADLREQVKSMALAFDELSERMDDADRVTTSTFNKVYVAFQDHAHGHGEQWSADQLRSAS
jgi:hypothetical protein